MKLTHHCSHLSLRKECLYLGHALPLTGFLRALGPAEKRLGGSSCLGQRAMSQIPLLQKEQTKVEH